MDRKAHDRLISGVCPGQNCEKICVCSLITPHKHLIIRLEITKASLQMIIIGEKYIANFARIICPD